MSCISAYRTSLSRSADKGELKWKWNNVLFLVIDLFFDGRLDTHIVADTAHILPHHLSKINRNQKELANCNIEWAERNFNLSNHSHVSAWNRKVCRETCDVVSLFLMQISQIWSHPRPRSSPSDFSQSNMAFCISHHSQILQLFDWKRCRKWEN